MRIAHFDVHGAVLSAKQPQDAAPGRYLFADDCLPGAREGARCVL